MANRFQVSSVERDGTKDASPTELGVALPLDTPRVVVVSTTPGGKEPAAGEGEFLPRCPSDLSACARSIVRRSGCVDGGEPPLGCCCCVGSSPPRVGGL